MRVRAFSWKGYKVYLCVPTLDALGMHCECDYGELSCAKGMEFAISRVGGCGGLGITGQSGRNSWEPKVLEGNAYILRPDWCPVAGCLE